MNLKQLGFEFYKECLESFLDLLKEKFGNRLLSFVLYGSVASCSKLRMVFQRFMFEKHNSFIYSFIYYETQVIRG